MASDLRNPSARNARRVQWASGVGQGGPNCIGRLASVRLRILNDLDAKGVILAANKRTCTIDFGLGVAT